MAPRELTGLSSRGVSRFLRRCAVTIEGACGVGVTEGRVRTGSAIDAYLRDLLLRHAHDDAARSRPTSPSSRASTRRSSASASRRSTARVYEAGRHARAVHDPVDLQAADLRVALERLGTDAVRSRIGVEPSGDAFNEISLPAHRNAAQPDDQRRGDRLRRRSSRARSTSRSRVCSRRTRRYAGRQLEIDEAVYRVGERHRAPQPRDGPHAAQLRRDRPARRRRSTSISGSARSRSTAATSP